MFISQTLGVMFFMFAEEHIGKRKMFLGGIFLIAFGSFIMFLSQSMAMAVVGQVIMGFSTFFLMRFCVAAVSNATEPKLSEKFVSTLEGFYAFGGVVGPLAYTTIKNWRTVILYFYCIDFALLLVLCFIFLQDTPRYLLRKCTAAEATKSLNFIATINNKPPLEEEEVKQLMEEEEKYTEVKENMSPLDLFRYPSIRIPSIVFCLLVLCFDLLYFGHATITDSIGLNPSLNLILMSGAEIIGILVLNSIVHLIKRRLTSRIMALIGVATSLILLLVRVPSNCEGCSLAIFQIALVMVARFCTGFMFGLFFVAQS